MSQTLKGVPQRWIDSNGEGITIAVIDTGYSNHEDLKDSIKYKKSVILGVNSPYDYTNGHGNMCMGIIAAQKKNIGGVEGIARMAKLISIKAIHENGETEYNNLINAIYFATALGADIISISAGGYSYSKDLEIAIRSCYELNIPVVCAAGNDGHVLNISNIQYPAKFKETICVGSISNKKELSLFSSIGEEIDFVAVGEKVRSTYLKNTYKEDSGTSFSAPYIAGIIALLLSKHRQQQATTGKNDCVTIEQIKDHLKKHTVDLGEEGKDVKYGYGAIDINSVFINKNKGILQKIIRKLLSIFKK